jgi:hypothetical protein
MNNETNKNIVIYSAGVLPYSVKSNGSIYFLLGKDYDNKWSDFGGRCEASDKSDISVTASREFWEETLGCIYDLSYIKKIVKKCDNVESKTYMGYPYYMYLVKIPYKEEYKSYFKCTRNFINATNIDRKYKEKIDIRWFSIDALSNHRGFFTIKSAFNNTFSENKHNIIEIINKTFQQMD